MIFIELRSCDFSGKHNTVSTCVGEIEVPFYVIESDNGEVFTIQSMLRYRIASTSQKSTGNVKSFSELVLKSLELIL